MPNARRSSGLLRIARCVTIAATLPLAATGARAQATPFVPSATHWVGPIGSAGVVHQGTQVWVDANGDALENPGDTHHAVPSGIDASWQLRLSPTRRIMIATRHSGGSCAFGTTQVRVFAIPRSDDDFVELGTAQTLAGCLNPTLFFDPDTTAPYRTAVFREIGQVGTDPEYLWWNLVTGENATSAFPFEYPTGYVEFAPSGTMAFVQHDVNGLDGTNYSLVNLCPGTLGQASQPGTQVNDAVHAWFVPGAPPTVDFRNSSGVSVGGAPYDDCSATDPLGACCKPDGSCAQTTQSGCTGTWTQGADCSVCPSAELSLQLAGPATAARGSHVTYTLTAANNGTLASNGVVVTNRVPNGAVFVSATAGGTYSASTGVVTWTLGTLGAGQQQALGLTVQAPCFGASLVNDVASISGTPGGTAPGAPAVTTTLTTPSNAGLTLTLLSQALDPVPLQTGGRVRHTVRMSNTTGTALSGVAFNLTPGPASEMLQVVDAGGGTVTLFSHSLQWSGPLPAMSVVDVVYETVVSDCRSTQPATEVMNNGFTVFVRNGCNFTLMFAMPTESYAVAPSPFSARLDSPTHGPVQVWGYTSANRMIACRSGDAVDVTLWLINASGASSPAANVALTLPAELPPAMDPPFVGTPPAGAAWDSGSQTLTWNGQVPANDSLGITLRIRPDTTACSGDLQVFGGIGSCTSLFATHLSVLPVHLPPPTALLTLSLNEGVRFMDPAQPGVWQPMLCGAFEILRGFGRTPDGTIWVAGEPSFRLQPEPLKFEVFPSSFYTALGMDYPYDMAGDPTDSTVVVAGYRSGFGLRLRRYDPATGQVTAILDNNNVATVGLGRHVTVSDDGIIGVNTVNFILRVDPANPPAYQSFAAPWGDVSGLTFDVDGNWLTTGAPASGSEARHLFKVDRDAGTFDSITDLSSYFTWYVDMPAIATAPNLDVYLASGEAILAKVARSAGNAVTTSGVTVNHVDYLWLGGAPPTTAVDPPAPGEGPASLALAPPRPNPARGPVELGFSLVAPGPASLAVYDVGGRRVRTLAEGEHAAGRHGVTWDGHADGGARLGAGLYFVKLVTPAGERVAKLVVAR